MIKYPAIHRMRRYTTSWNVCAQKMTMPQSWVERTAVQNSAIRNSCRKYSSNYVGAILLTDLKIFTVVTPKNPKESPTVRNCSNKEERRWCRTPAHTINVQIVSVCVSVCPLTYHALFIFHFNVSILIFRIFTAPITQVAPSSGCSFYPLPPL